MQTASLMSTVIGTSAAAFTIHNVSGQKAAAAAHPPLMYAMIVVLVLLPAEIAFKVIAHSATRVHSPINVIVLMLCVLPEPQSRVSSLLSLCYWLLRLLSR